MSLVIDQLDDPQVEQIYIAGVRLAAIFHCSNISGPLIFGMEFENSEYLHSFVRGTARQPLRARVFLSWDDAYDWVYGATA